MCQNRDSSLVAIMAQKDGRPDWRRIGHDFPMIVRKARNIHWELTDPSFWNIIADMDGLLSDPYPV